MKKASRALAETPENFPASIASRTARCWEYGWLKSEPSIGSSRVHKPGFTRFVEKVWTVRADHERLDFKSDLGRLVALRQLGAGAGARGLAAFETRASLPTSRRGGRCWPEYSGECWPENLGECTARKLGPPPAAGADRSRLGKIFSQVCSRCGVGRNMCDFHRCNARLGRMRVKSICGIFRYVPAGTALHVSRQTRLAARRRSNTVLAGIGGRLSRLAVAALASGLLPGCTWPSSRITRTFARSGAWARITTAGTAAGRALPCARAGAAALARVTARSTLAHR